MDYTLAKLHKPKTGNDWYVYYTFRSPETGKMQLFKERQGINRLKTVNEKRREGAILVTSVNNRLKGGWSPFAQIEENPFSGKSLSEVLGYLYEIKKPTLRKRSQQHYSHAVDLIREFLNGSKIAPENFTPAMAQKYSDFLVGKKGYTAGTHNNQLSNIRIFFNAMVDRDIISKNPFKKIRNKPVEEGKLTFYSKEQKKLIRDYTFRNEHPMYLFIPFLYYCFIRPNEIMHLQVKHIDFENEMITIPAHISKNRKHGIVPMPPQFAKQVKERFGHLEKEMHLFGYGHRPNFKKGHRNRASESHKLLLRELKISNDHILYDWKNTGARDFILSGGNPYDLMARMRHHSLDQTMVYLRSLGVTTGMKTDPEAWIF